MQTNVHQSIWKQVLTLGLCLLNCGPLGAESLEPAEAEQGAETVDGDNRVIEEIVVTGSRLLRRDYVANSPISTLDQSVLNNTAQPTLEDALNQMPQVIPDFGRTSNNPGTGQSTINLRGLGASRTLVMLNGRRLAPAGVGSSVDVNTIPQALIDRVEVITGGATTVYGSDAVAGVVNFVTRRDFDGIEIESSAYATEKGDSEVYDVNLAWGRNFTGNSGNLTVFGGYMDRKASFAGEREISSVPLFDAGSAGILQGGSYSTPAGLISSPQVDLGYGPVYGTFDDDGNLRAFVDPRDEYNYAPANYLQVPLQRRYAGAFITYPFTPAVELYIELTYTRNEGRQNLAPAVTGESVEVNLDNPVLTPQTRQVFSNSFAVSPRNTVQFFLRRRLEELGPRIVQATNDYSRIVAGLRGNFTGGWEYDAWMTYTNADEHELLMNSASRTRYLQGLLVDPVTGECYDPSGGCVPLNPFGPGNITGAQIDFLRLASFTNTTTRTQKLVSAFVRGTLFQGKAGPASVAIGAEWRSDSGRFHSDDALVSGDALGYTPSSSVIGDERVSEIYVEGLVPLAQNVGFVHYLGLEMGARHSKYQNAGVANTYKVGGEWEPVESVRFRSMFQRSVRAPNLFEAFEQQRNDLGTYVNTVGGDACSADEDPVGHGYTDKCVIQGIPADQVGVFQATQFFPVQFVSGGNAQLEPETADSYTAGVVYSGIDDWTLTLDYFDISVDKTIGTADPDLVCYSPGNTGNVLCDSFTRDPVTFNVSRIDMRTTNLGELHTAGFDVQVGYKTDLPGKFALGGTYASLAVNAVWTHTRTNTVQQNPAVDAVECAGYFGVLCRNVGPGVTFPADRALLNADYSTGKVSALLSWRWIEGTRNSQYEYASALGQPVPDLAIPDIGARSYVDIGLGYRLGQHVSLRLNVANVFDRDPPLMADSAWSNNTDTSMYDIFGRSYQLTLAWHALGSDE